MFLPSLVTFCHIWGFVTITIYVDIFEMVNNLDINFVDMIRPFSFWPVWNIWRVKAGMQNCIEMYWVPTLSSGISESIGEQTDLQPLPSVYMCVSCCVLRRRSLLALEQSIHDLDAEMNGKASIWFLQQKALTTVLEANSDDDFRLECCQWRAHVSMCLVHTLAIHMFQVAQHWSRYGAFDGWPVVGCLTVKKVILLNAVSWIEHRSHSTVVVLFGSLKREHADRPCGSSMWTALVAVLLKGTFRSIERIPKWSWEC